MSQEALRVYFLCTDGQIGTNNKNDLFSKQIMLLVIKGISLKNIILVWHSYFTDAYHQALYRS